MTITPNPAWTRAMQRALASGYRPTRRVDGSYRVPSKSCPGTVHIVSVDEAGHITHCDCKGWEQGGRQRPCWHAGAVALARLFLLGAHITPQRTLEPASVGSLVPTRRQILRIEAGA